MARICRTDRGQALVEFALVLPLLLLLLVGSMGVGLLLIQRSSLQFAAQQTAVAVAEAAADCTLVTARMTQLYDGPFTASCTSAGQVVTVTARTDVVPLVPGLPEQVEVQARAWVTE